MQCLPERDLDEIVAACEDSFRSLRGAHVFVTGGTGFVGSWLVESLLWANERLALGARLSVLTRDPVRVGPRFARAAEGGVLALVAGDVRTFDCDIRPDVIINAATPTANEARDPLLVTDVIVSGAANVLRFAARSGKIPVLFTSSGAVYGRQPPTLERISETYAGAPDQLDPRFAYHEAKRTAELLHVAAGRASGILPKIARLFAFVGPYLPLDQHFAVGNFVRDALGGGPIVVTGDGTALRSYLYASDMTAWLWQILGAGKAERPYNVGSGEAISIADTARAVAAAAGLADRAVEIREVSARGTLPERYVPNVERAARELGLRVAVPFEAALDRTIRFCDRNHTARIA
jgi:nucleoside-diphosphate-sugar epimerase